MRLSDADALEVAELRALVLLGRALRASPSSGAVKQQQHQQRRDGGGASTVRAAPRPGRLPLRAVHVWPRAGGRALSTETRELLAFELNADAVLWHEARPLAAFGGAHGDGRGDGRDPTTPDPMPPGSLRVLCLAPQLVPDRRALGVDFRSRLPSVLRALADANRASTTDASASPLAAALAAAGGGKALLELELQEPGARGATSVVTLEPRHVACVEWCARAGFCAVAPDTSQHGLVLDLAVDDALVSRYVARELTHRVQGARKERGLRVRDRVALVAHVERCAAEAGDGRVRCGTDVLGARDWVGVVAETGADAATSALVMASPETADAPFVFKLHDETFRASFTLTVV